MIGYPEWSRWARAGRAFAGMLVRAIGHDRASAFLTTAVRAIGWDAVPIPTCRACGCLTVRSEGPGKLCPGCSLLHQVLHAGEVARG